MQVAETIAGLHGLKMQVTPTTTLVSRYYKTNRVEGSLAQFARTTTEWDLLIYTWLRREPENSWVDNAEVIGDLVAVDGQFLGIFSRRNLSTARLKSLKSGAPIKTGKE